MATNDEALKQAQAAGEAVEDDMLKFLIQFAPTRELKVGDVLQIAMFARTKAFDHFYYNAQIKP